MTYYIMMHKNVKKAIKVSHANRNKKQTLKSNADACKLCTRETYRLTRLYVYVLIGTYVVRVEGL